MAYIDDLVYAKLDAYPVKRLIDTYGVTAYIALRGRCRTDTVRFIGLLTYIQLPRRIREKDIVPV